MFKSGYEPINEILFLQSIMTNLIHRYVLPLSMLLLPDFRTFLFFVLPFCLITHCVLAGLVSSIEIESDSSK